MVHNTAKLGGAASDVVVGKVAVSHVVQLNGPLSQTFYSFQLARQSQHGLMMMTVKPTPVPDEEAFAAIKAGIDTLPPGVKMFLNSGGCGSSCLHHLDIVPDSSRGPKAHAPSFLYTFFSRVLRARLDDGKPRAARALLRQVPRIRGARLPLCQGWDDTRPDGVGREQGEPAQERRCRPQGLARDEEARSVRACEARIELRDRALRGSSQ